MGDCRLTRRIEGIEEIDAEAGRQPDIGTGGTWAHQSLEAKGLSRRADRDDRGGDRMTAPAPTAVEIAGWSRGGVLAGRAVGHCRSNPSVTATEERARRGG